MKKIIVIVIFLGSVAFTLNYVFGSGLIPFVQEQGIGLNGEILAYRYDTWGYLDNVKDTFMDIDGLRLQLPERTWAMTNNITDIGNNMAVMLNAIVTGLNILIYPIRLGFFAIQLVLALLGVNIVNPQESGLKWLIDLTKTMKSLQIPYV